MMNSKSDSDFITNSKGKNDERESHEVDMRSYELCLFLSVTQRDFTRKTNEKQTRSATEIPLRQQLEQHRQKIPKETMNIHLEQFLLLFLFHFSNVHKNANSISRIDRWTVLPTHLWFVKPFSQ